MWAKKSSSNPPPASEAPLLEKLKAIGIVPGEKFDASKLDPAVAAVSVAQIALIATALLVADRYVKLTRVV